MPDMHDLHRGVLEGNLDEVQRILGDDPKAANLRNHEGDTPLHLACSAKLGSIITSLIISGADVNARGSRGRTPLHCAVCQGRASSMPIVFGLLHDGADPDIRDDDGLTPEDRARIEMKGDALTHVLTAFQTERRRRSRKAELGARQQAMPKTQLPKEHESEKLHEWILRGSWDNMERLLKEHPELVHVRDSSGDTPLHVACREKRIAAAMLLLGHGSDVNARGGRGQTPLHSAIDGGDITACPLVVALLSYGADPRLLDENGFTPANWAVNQMKDGLLEVVELLERAAKTSEPPRDDGASVDPSKEPRVEVEDDPQIHKLAFAGDTVAVGELLNQNGSLISRRNKYGDMPLHHACWNKKVETVTLLLGRGAEVNARGAHGQTPLHYAIKEEEPETVPIVAALLAHGADPDICDDAGYSAVDRAKLELETGLNNVLNLFAKRG